MPTEEAMRQAKLIWAEREKGFPKFVRQTWEQGTWAARAATIAEAERRIYRDVWEWVSLKFRGEGRADDRSSSRGKKRRPGGAFNPNDLLRQASQPRALYKLEGS